MGLHLSKFKSGSHSCERTHLSRQKKGVGRLGHPWVNSFELYITYPTDSYSINMSDCCKSINWFPIMFYFDSVAGVNCSTCWAFSFECGILNKPKNPGIQCCSFQQYSALHIFLPFRCVLIKQHQNIFGS